MRKKYPKIGTGQDILQEEPDERWTKNRSFTEDSLQHDPEVDGQRDGEMELGKLLVQIGSK